MAGSGLSFRPIRPADREFLYRLYADTRQEELAPLHWPAAQVDAFLRMQFAAQHAHYQEHFAGASFDLILRRGEAIGRLYVDRQEEEIRVIDISLLAVHRSAGIGTALMQEILEEGARTSRPVRLHVHKHSRAQRLYRRLGFRQIEDHGVSYLMEWVPAVPAGTRSES